MQQTQIWAHRGASGYAPENTMEAFDLAIKSKADGIEIDVHLTADNQIVVAHDETVDRCCKGTGRITDMTLEQLQQLDASCGMEHYAGAKIPTLADVLDLLRPTHLSLNIEMKTNVIIYAGLEEAVLKMVADHGMTDRVIYSSFNHYTLQRMRALSPTAQLGILYSEGMVNPWEYAVRIQANALHPHYLSLRVPGLVTDAHRAGVRVHPWTLNNEQTICRALQCGVDAIITNYPDLALRMREAQPTHIG